MQAYNKSVIYFFTFAVIYIHPVPSPRDLTWNKILCHTVRFVHLYILDMWMEDDTSAATTPLPKCTSIYASAIEMTCAGHVYHTALVRIIIPSVFSVPCPPSPPLVYQVKSKVTGLGGL
jgi:hypothetical protein